MRSISRRIHRAILLVSMACIAVMVVMVLEVNEDLERTMLQMEFEQELDFILENRNESELFVWEGFNQQLVFVPQGQATPAQMPEVFRDLPLGFSDEIKRGKNTYLVNIAVLPKGVVYIAKDITHFEDREFLFSIALGAMTLLILGLGLWLATLSSRRIVDPLRQLSEQISEVPVGSQMPRIPVNYTDSELYSIAETFNRFLGELESYVRREQSLLSLASHELRTPVAVMSGALDILEMRGQLKPNDLATVARMRNACTEMRSNVEVLLKLSRNQDDASPVREVISLTTLVEEVLDDLNNLFKVRARVRLNVMDRIMLSTDVVLVKMLLRNLIQNALQHTQKEIDITLGKGVIQIKDRGTGLTAGQKAILNKEMEVMPGSASLNGLGLYIVTLMSERLQWPLQVAQSDSSGSVIQLNIPAHQLL